MSGPAPQPRQALVASWVSQMVGTIVIAAVIEEANVVVLLFQRFDFARDEFIELGKISAQRCRNVEVHVGSFSSSRAIMTRWISLVPS